MRGVIYIFENPSRYSMIHCVTSVAMIHWPYGCLSLLTNHIKSQIPIIDKMVPGRLIPMPNLSFKSLPGLPELATVLLFPPLLPLPQLLPKPQLYCRFLLDDALEAEVCDGDCVMAPESTHCISFETQELEI